MFNFSSVVTPSGDTRKLAVAVHSITFVNSGLEFLGSLVFGTSEANVIQGEGWYENEVMPKVGSYQWAGGGSKKSTFTLQIPQGTEGLLLNVTSVRDGIWVNVTMDGTRLTTLRVDSYWHSAYVPISDIIQIPETMDAPNWVEGHYFPWFPETDEIYAIRVRTELEDNDYAYSARFNISDAYKTAMALTITSMQGIINRNGPKVYLDWVDNDSENASSFWIPLLRQYVDVKYLDLDGLSALNFLYWKFASRFKGAVIYDPSMPDTINLATMISGLEDRVIVGPTQVGLQGFPLFGSMTDLRQLVREQGWAENDVGKYEMYNWVYENLWPRLEHRIIGVISPGPPTSRYSSGYFPLSLAGRDYIVALRLTALWLSPILEPEAGLFSKFLEDAPSPIPVTSVYSGEEEGTTALVAKHGDFIAAINWPGNDKAGSGCLTVLSGIRPKISQYNAKIDTDRLFATLDDKPVVTMWSSDGDNVVYQLGRGFHGGVDFVWDEVNDKRFGWTINPTLIDLAPIVWNYYVESGRGASLIGGLSGCGYTYPVMMSDTQLRGYLDRAAMYMNETGLRVIHIDDRFGGSWSDVAVNYYDTLKEAGFLGSFFGGGMLPSDMTYKYEGEPAPGVIPFWVMRPGNGQIIVQDILSSKPGIYVERLSNYGNQFGQVVLDRDAITGKAVVFVREKLPPPTMVINGPFAILPPGHYKVTYRLKVPDNREHLPIAQMFVAYDDGQWHMLKNLVISPSSFGQPNMYQNFTIEFSLDHTVSGIQYWLDYFGRTTNDYATVDMYADSIVVVREEAPALPVFAGIFISLMVIDPMNQDMQKIMDMEKLGGVVLQPDEFMAALNPEFMIEWAAPILGDSNAGLIDAKSLLAKGEYLESLLATRKALLTLPSRTYHVEAMDAGKSIPLEISGNTYITSLIYDSASSTVKFNTHGPPKGTAVASITLPDEIQGSQVKVRIDGQAQLFTISQSPSKTVLALTFNQGAHTMEVELPFNRAPTANFRCYPLNPTIRDAVSFINESQDSDGQIVAWHWDLGDGASSAISNPTHIYQAKGSYTVILSVQDDDGSISEKVATLVVANLPPISAFSYSPSSPVVKEQIHFNDESSDPEGRIQHVTWDFGDGVTSNESNPTHSYLIGGDYTVMMTAWDEEGASSISSNIIRVSPTFMLLVRVLDPLGIPITDAKVEVSLNDQKVSQGRTDGSGIFSTDGLVSGTYIVEANHMGFSGSSTTILTQDTELQLRVPLSMNLVYIGVGAIIAAVVIIYLIQRRGRARS